MATLGIYCKKLDRSLGPGEAVNLCAKGDARKRACLEKWCEGENVPCRHLRLFVVVNGKNWRSDDRRNGNGDEHRPTTRELMTDLAAD